MTKCNLVALLCALSLGATTLNTRLADAVMNGDNDAVRSLLKQGQVNAPQADGTTALHWAVRQDDLEIVDLLIHAGANVKAVTRYGVTPLYLACTNGNAAMIEKLIGAGGDANSANPAGETALMTAARTEKVDAVKVLLDRVLNNLVDNNAAVNAKESVREQTALMWAVLENHPEVVKLLLAHGAEINAKTNIYMPEGDAPPARNAQASGVGIARQRAVPTPNGNMKPLLFAARDGNLEMTRLRIEEHRANPVCAACHKIMDPIGLALENFDGVGQWRDTDSGFKIDPSSQLVDGTKIDGPASLRKALLSRPEAFVGTLTEKLLMYGAGRELHYYDMPVARAISRQAAAHNYQFSSIILGIVNSAPFQMRVKALPGRAELEAKP